MNLYESIRKGFPIVQRYSWNGEAAKALIIFTYPTQAFYELDCKSFWLVDFIFRQLSFINGEVFIRNAKWLSSSSFRLCIWQGCDDFISLAAIVSFSPRWSIVFVVHRQMLPYCRKAHDTDSYESSLSCLHNGLLLVIPESRGTSGEILFSVFAYNITYVKSCLFQWEIVFFSLRRNFEIEVCRGKACTPKKCVLSQVIRVFYSPRKLSSQRC